MSFNWPRFKGDTLPQQEEEKPKINYGTISEKEIRLLASQMVGDKSNDDEPINGIFRILDKARGETPEGFAAVIAKAIGVEVKDVFFVEEDEEDAPQPEYSEGDDHRFKFWIKRTLPRPEL